MGKVGTTTASKLAVQPFASTRRTREKLYCQLTYSCSVNLAHARCLPSKMWFRLHVVMYNNSGYFSNNSKEVVSIYDLHSLLHKFGRKAVESLRLPSMTSYGSSCYGFEILLIAVGDQHRRGRPTPALKFIVVLY